MVFNFESRSRYMEILVSKQFDACGWDGGGDPRHLPIAYIVSYAVNH